jgi:valyl-tRNA synthetase
MDISKTFESGKIEQKWYRYWKENGYFHSEPDEREPYTIVIPPPNVTGVLHMGHMLNNTIQDVLIRRARMLGLNACWVPGMDHASIATEAKVVAMLKEKGTSKKDITREQFLDYAWEWKEKYGGIILKQLEKLGASCDWERTRFTMEKDLSDAVIKVFVDLYNKGRIYRGVRMVNWDPQGKTAVSDEEVNYKEVNSRLYYVKYAVEGEENNFVTIATTRPETILGDTAVCVHPDDERYKKLKGKRVIVPLVNRSVPVIYDEYVTMEFGTGALKITPAHDLNDYELGIKHKLLSIDILNDDGTLSRAAELYVGMDRFEARKKIVDDLIAAGLLVKTEDLINKVGYSERTNAVIEPKLSTQWFLQMKELCQPALDNVMNDNIKLVPDKFKNTYRHWMENVHDWCISRQLWWGQQIPAYYLPDGSFVVAETKEEALKIAKEIDSEILIDQLTQDEDVLDTWFSSWLWPISVFDGFKNPDNKDIKYYYPTNVLVTAPEILFFWVARMIIAGYEYRGDKPFHDVYLTGIVRDKLGRKMSKSLGNSPEPIELIEKYGADGVRTGMLFSSPAGNDILFDEAQCEQGRNFNNKIWNAFRLINSWEIKDIPQPDTAAIAISWFEAKFYAELNIINDHFSKYRISEALMLSYKLTWDDFCSWYLEMIKPGFQQPVDKVTYEKTINYFEKILKLLHPFIPFITEEIWHLIKEREKKDCIIISHWPDSNNYDKELLTKFDQVMEVITAIRNIRKEKNISFRETIDLLVKKAGKTLIFSGFEPVVKKLCNINEIKLTDGDRTNAVSFIVHSTQYYISAGEMIDMEEERVKLIKELEYAKGFLKSVDAKLSNERFVNNAKPEIITNERKKKSDAEARIKTIEDQLESMRTI